MTVPTLTSPPVPSGLVITRRAVGGDLGDRIADAGQVGKLVPLVPEAAGRLGAALDQVPGRAGAGQPVPVVPGPAVMGRRRAERQRGVGHPARDHDPAAGLRAPRRSAVRPR